MIPTACLRVRPSRSTLLTNWAVSKEYCARLGRVRCRERLESIVLGLERSKAAVLAGHADLSSLEAGNAAQDRASARSDGGMDVFDICNDPGIEAQSSSCALELVGR